MVTPLPSKSTLTPSTSSKTTISPIPSTSATQQAVLTSAAPLKSSKKRKSDEVDKLDKQIEQLIGDNDADEAFFLSMAWAARFRKLSPYQQAVVRSGVDNVFFNAEFQTPTQPPSHTSYTPTYTDLF